MHPSTLRGACLFAWLVARFAADSFGQQPEIVKPLRVVHFERGSAASQVIEGATPESDQWAILHRQGLKIVNLKIVNIESGEEKVVWQAPADVPLGIAKSDHLLTPDGEFFGVTTFGQPIATIRRTADGSAIAELDSRELFDRPAWNGQFILGQDATHVFTVLHKRGAPHKLCRVDIFPSPRVAASHTLGSLPVRALSTLGPSGILAVSQFTDNHAKPGSLRIFDHQLELQHQEKLPGLSYVFAATRRPTPLVAIRSRVNDDGVRVKGQPHWMFGELNLDAEPTRRKGKSLLTPRLVFNEWAVSGAFSPDGKWLVISRDDELPKLDIRSTYDGQLLRRFDIAGGQHRLLTHRIITRLAFSQSGRYLCASDGSNAYLLDFQELIESSDSGSE
jgi:hypothetical protein